MPDNEVRKSKYEKTRRRISRYINNSELADREIIEYLAEEIEQYREKIKQQEKIIDNLNSEITREECMLDEDDGLMDPDIEEITSTTVYAGGKPVETRMKYKYKTEKDRKLNALYIAEIYEYDNGDEIISYMCDKNKNKECNKENCELCTHTLEKKYARNYFEKNS